MEPDARILLVFDTWHIAEDIRYGRAKLSLWRACYIENGKIHVISSKNRPFDILLYGFDILLSVC